MQQYSTVTLSPDFFWGMVFGAILCFAIVCFLAVVEQSRKKP